MAGMLIETNEKNWATSALNVMHDITVTARNVWNDLKTIVEQEATIAKRRDAQKAAQITDTYTRDIVHPLYLDYNKVKERYEGIIAEAASGEKAILWLTDYIEDRLIRVGDNIAEVYGTNLACDRFLREKYIVLTASCEDIRGKLGLSSDRRLEANQKLLTTTAPSDLTEKLCHDILGFPKFVQSKAGHLAASDTLKWVVDHGGLGIVGKNTAHNKLCEIVEDFCEQARDKAINEARDYYVDNESRAQLTRNCARLADMLYPKVYRHAVSKFTDLIDQPEYADAL